ncbi:MAG: GDSL-type esterase/lipase family protein [Bacteroidales bacterium]
MVKPHKTFLFLLVLLVLLVALTMLVPKEGIRLGNYTVSFPSPLELFELDTTQNRDEFKLVPEIATLDKLIDSLMIAGLEDSVQYYVDSLPARDTTQTLEPDSIYIRIDTIPHDSRLTADILKGKLIPIETNDSNLEPLAPFFKALASGRASTSQVRILHYGDSQIEGDRVSSFLRSRLQNRFGGNGVGLLHAVPHSYQPGAVHQSSSSNWRKMLLPDLGKEGLGSKFGLQGGYSIFTKTRRTRRGGYTEAWIRLQRIGSHNSSARNYTHLKVIYGDVEEPFLISLNYKGETQQSDMVPPLPSISQITWSVPVSVDNVQLDFKGDESPKVYGVSLESKTGIILDNIAIRGSSGADFTRADDNALKQALDIVSPKLIILQFGVNIVPHVVDSYKYYENQMYRQVLALKRANPNTAILLVGVSDMSKRESGRYVSYPNIKKIRDAQRNAAFRAGAAFWDCYKAMGGENSMPAWVYADPPLASKDFVHFTLRGSNLIAEMFYSSLMQSYERYVDEINK